MDDLDWLKLNVLTDDFEWDKSWKTDILKFCNKYSLHDSRWVGVFTYPRNYSTNLIIELDTCSLSENTAKKGGPCYRERWPILIIKLSSPTSIKCVNKDSSDEDIVSVSTAIPSERILKELDLNGEFVETIIQECYGGDMSIIHTKGINILLFDRNGNLIIDQKGNVDQKIIEELTKPKN